MQITIGKKLGFRKGETICFETYGHPKVYCVVYYLDAGTSKVRLAARWEIFEFNALMLWRRLKRAIRNRR